LNKWNFMVSVGVLLAVVLIGSGCGSSSNASSTTASTSTTSTSTTPNSSKTQTFGKIAVTSSAFNVGGPIPVRYTCDGAGVSPPLQWSGIPRGTAEIAVLAFDISPQTTSSVQWAVAGISPSASELVAGKLPAGAVVGANSAGKDGWGGMCGPKGQQQHAVFFLYALKTKLGLKPGFKALAVRKRFTAEKLASGLTLATYERP
jgi:Raf kinase inhibitor-like YbhB/YbcL family protein